MNLCARGKTVVGSSALAMLAREKECACEREKEKKRDVHQRWVSTVTYTLTLWKAQIWGPANVVFRWCPQAILLCVKQSWDDLLSNRWVEDSSHCVLHQRETILFFAHSDWLWQPSWKHHRVESLQCSSLHLLNYSVLKYFIFASNWTHKTKKFRTRIAIHQLRVTHSLWIYIFAISLLC